MKKWLQKMRTALGIAIGISSGYRCEAHNKRVGGGPAHPTGKAADLAVSGYEAVLVTTEAYLRTGIVQIQGFGVKQTGPYNKRFLHLDTLRTEEIVGAVRPRIWSY